MGILQSSLYFSSVTVPCFSTNATTPGSSSSGGSGNKSNGTAATQTRAMGDFVMPLHYPRYSKEDYETMPEVVLDRLLTSYGLPVGGDLNCKREDAMGHFLWPSQRPPSTTV